MSGKGLYDIHCHIVPSVDDGSSDIEESYHMLQMEYQQGVRNIIVTPHFRFQMFETPIETVEQQFLALKQIARKIAPDLHIYLGCEFHSNMQMVEMLLNNEVHTMAGSHYVLTEFSGISSADYIYDRLYSLLTHGFKPIIAHIERCECLRKDLDFVEELTNLGAYMQINADSVIGKEGFAVKRYCRKLMKQNLLSFVASDCHGIQERISRIGEAYAYISKKQGSTYADRIFIENPQEILIDAKKYQKEMD